MGGRLERVFLGDSNNWYQELVFVLRWLDQPTSSTAVEEARDPTQEINGDEDGG